MPQKHDIGTQKRLRRLITDGRPKSNNTYLLALNLVQRGLATKEILSDRPSTAIGKHNRRGENR
jgi:hypothetical protein